MPKKAPSKSPMEEEIETKLTEFRRKEEEQQAQNLAKKLGLTYLDLTTLPIETDAILTLDETTARQGKMAVINKTDETVKIVTVDPGHPATKKFVSDLSQRGLKPQLYVVSHRSLTKALNVYQEIAQVGKEITGQVEITSELLARFQQEFKGLEDIKKVIQGMPQDEATHVLEAIIAGALKTDASDIHLEGREKDSLLRYRIDGILHDVVFLSLKSYGLLLARLKLLSGMILNVRDQAQDGRFTIRLQSSDLEVRVSVIPGPNGENIVMRVLNPKNINLNLKDLGFRQDIYEFIEKEIRRPNGMIITTGPTGSGKTTALYAFLKEVTDPEVKIITLEDPIEYHLIGVTQTQVETDRGYTFAAGLRAILRQDPDIVLVGEIRDKETAEIALHAALTGHIVFSTLHTNDAAGAIPRFIDMGANPTILSAALIDIMAQRLLRRICPDCKSQYQPSHEETEKIKAALSNLPKTVKVPPLAADFKLWKGRGCPKCNGTGYRSRVGIYEIIPINIDMEKLITKAPSHAEVLEVASKNNFVSMYQDGIIKVVEGVTTLEELEDIVGEAGSQR